jgi:glucokinase
VLEELATGVVSDAGITLQACAGIVVGFPGIVDTQTSAVIATNAKFDDAVEIDLSAWAKLAFGLPLRIENDARLALLGEHYCGAAKAFDDVVLVTLGTGIGAAAMLNGKPLRGKSQHAGCLGGHLPVAMDGRKCTCGNVGCAEAEASTWALPQICRSWPGFEASALSQLSDINFSSLFRAADAQDSVAKEIVAHCCRVWATLAVALIHAYSPEVLLFGGGVMARASEILPIICAHVQQHAWMPRHAVQIKPAALGPNAPLLGAIPLLMETIR